MLPAKLLLKGTELTALSRIMLPTKMFLKLFTHFTLDSLGIYQNTL